MQKDSTVHAACYLLDNLVSEIPNDPISCKKEYIKIAAMIPEKEYMGQYVGSSIISLKEKVDQVKINSKIYEADIIIYDLIENNNNKKKVKELSEKFVTLVASLPDIYEYHLPGGTFIPERILQLKDLVKHEFYKYLPEYIAAREKAQTK